MRPIKITHFSWTGFKEKRMNPNLSVILTIAGVVLLFVLWIFYENYKMKKRFLERIRKSWGEPTERQYETGEIEQISHYFRRRETEGFTIDDITWNDLDMDRLYRMVNKTISSPGEDVLYDMMRRPLFSREELEEREELVEFFSTHQKEREEMQMLLCQVGKTRLHSLSDTVLALNSSPKVKTGIHGFMLVLLVLNLAVLLPWNPVAGFFTFLILMVVNITIYYAGNDRKLIEAYLDCFAHLLRMLSVAEEMKTVKWSEVRKQMEAIEEGKKAFAGLRHKAFFLTSKNTDGGDPSQIVMEYIRMLTHVDILVYNGLLKEVQGKSDSIMKLIDNIGELDACISIASFRKLLALWCKPKFTDWVYEGRKLEASTKRFENQDKEKGILAPVTMKVEDLYHPLLEEAVANSFQVSGGTLVTGSNASGKSTFLKNVAMNSILAQTLGTCTCSLYQAPFLKVMTSMALRDDIESGESYFIVEIKSLKRILEESKKPEPVLCIIDEVLRGTNTIERIAASSRILAALRKPWVLPFAATHDIELSYILDSLYENYHFEEEVREKEVVFSYILQKGRTTSRNAIQLLDMLGYDPKIVKGARGAAADFEKNGVWDTLSQ